MRRGIAYTGALALGVVALGCAGNQAEKKPAEPTAEAEQAAIEAAALAAENAPDTCPAMAKAPALLPGVRPEHKQLDYWLKQLGSVHKLDEELLSPDAVRRLNASMRVPRSGFYPQRDLLEPVDAAAVVKQVASRVEYLAKKLASKDYVGKAGQPLVMDSIGALAESEVAPTLRVALASIEIRCAPTAKGYYSASLDLRIDHNACSAVHGQEPLQVLASWPAGWQLVRTRYTTGWIPGDAPLSPPVPDNLQSSFVHGPFASVTGEKLALPDGVSLEEGTRLPMATGAKKRRGRRSRRHSSKARGGLKLRVAKSDGFETVAVANARPVNRALTRRAVLTEAFRYLGTPYGFGGRGAGRDCSRFLLDLFESFGLELPRHSSWQAKAGTFSIPLKGVAERDRLTLLDEASKRGIVLMQLPGHIMLYLGRDDAGEPMALHAFAEYQSVCAEPDPKNSETKMLIDNIEVSTLSLGRGTSKKAFINRITRLTVLGKKPGATLLGAAEQRPALPVVPPKRRRDCRGGRGFMMFVSPRYPNAEEPVRVTVVSRSHMGPVDLALVDPKGNVVRPTAVKLGGPPYGLVATVANPGRGTWKAVLGDGQDVRACKRIHVARKLPRRVEKKAKKKYRRKRAVNPDAAQEAPTIPASMPMTPGAAMLAATAPRGVPVWKVRRGWGPRTAELYALFVERLFDYPVDQDLTWNGLHVLLRDKDRNILYNYLGLGEDEKIRLFPDCAELSYNLRSYFSWKLGLPFAYTKCKRARPGHPPECEPAGSNLMARAQLEKEEDDDVGAFVRFTAREVNTSVNSSSGRTHPEDEVGDYYPVPLQRRALMPGTLFNDPYGHVLVVADWVAQGAGDYGVLIAADAQPDGTVGRRRFWRGSFLWKPDTESGGAGFKAYRPAVLNKETGLIERVENKKLQRRRSRWTRMSDGVYKKSADGFYRQMESLINPRPLDPNKVVVSLVDALQEAVVRRVVSLDNGETFMREESGGVPMAMPTGKRIFLSSAPWEDFSTPSRDLRLLISIHTVLALPADIEAAPARFGVVPANAKATADRIRTRLRAELGRRTFEYTRSDGEKQQLSLADVADRATGFEMAYNPNDCVEIRWAAPAGSSEMKSCRRHAPAEQRAEMQRLRPWFAKRDRPAN